MSEIHPREIDLARFGDGEVSAGIAEHLRWCAHCRSVVADYRWLQGELAATLALAANTVPVPSPKWLAVQGYLFADQRRQTAGWRASALISVMLVACFLLSAPNLLVLCQASFDRFVVTTSVVSAVRQATRIATTSHQKLEAVTVPAPATAVVSGEPMASMATPTPAISCEEARPLPTPAFVLPPTPLVPET